MIGSFARPGDTPLHRLGAGTKLAGLAVLATLLFLISEPPVLAVALAAAIGLARSTGATFRDLARDLRAPALVLAALGLVDWLFVDTATAVTVVLRLGALMFLAHAVTVTTTTSELTEVLERLFVPLDRIGLVDAERAALTVTLAIRFVPLLMDEVGEIREAQAVRGLSGNPIALAVPLLVRVLVRAEEVADAIDARGFPALDRTRRDPPSPPSHSTERPSNEGSRSHDHA